MGNRQEDDNAPQNNRAKEVGGWAKILEDRPGLWLILGLGMFFVAIGSLNLSTSFIILHQPSDITLRGCLLFMGVSIFLLSCYIIMRTKCTGTRCLEGMLVALWLVLAVAVAYSSITTAKPKGPVVRWGYGVREKAFEVTISPLQLTPWQGQDLMLIVMKENGKIDASHDPNISKSDKFSVPAPNEGEFSREVDCSRIAKNIKINDMILCSVVAVPKGIQLNNLKDIAGLKNRGGKVIQMVGASAAIDGSDPLDLAFAYKQLPGSQQRDFKNDVKWH